MYPTHLKRIHLFNLSWRLRFFLFFFLLTYIPTNAQVYSWAKSMGGLGSDRSYNIAVDASGNIYTTGVFRNTADFDPNAGTFNLTSTGGEDIFVSKLDASGNFVWAKSIGGTSNDQGNSIVVDASGNVYTTGFFQGTADFDPGTGVFNLTSAGSYDIFVSKLDASGNFVWAKSIGGTSLDFSNSIAIDASGNVYTTGIFEGTVDFDPNAGVFNLTSASFFGDIFVSKLDASGNFVWAKSMGGFNDDQAYNITIDASGNVYTTGFFQGTADFDPGTGVFNLASAGSYDIFVSKLDASGNFVWAKNMGGTGFDQGNSIVVDASGNVYTTGIFRNTADFDPGTGVFNLTSAGFNDIFVSKLDASGNFVWAKSMGAGGTNDDQGKGIVVDASGNVYTTGFFQGTADFDPDTGVFNLTSAGLDEIFISKLDPSGNFVWAKSMEGTGFDQGYDIAIDASGNIYTTGFFQGAVDFNPGLGVAGLNSQGGDDIFVSKLSPCPTITITTASLPNGTIGSTYSQTISQTGLTGTPAWSVSAGALPNGLSINSSTGAISGTPSATGTFNFTVQVTDGDCSQTKAYSIVISCPTITFTNTTASNATVGTSYNLDASVTGNTQTVTYSVNPALPAGLSLNTSTGVISGTPSAQTASATYTVTASQSAGVCSVTQNYTFAVVCPTASLSPSSLPNGTIGTTYNQTISQTGLPAGTITWSVSLGTLPTGLSLNSSTGVISGTPTATGTFNFTIEASNSGCLASRAYSIVVSCPTITFTNTTALSAVIGTAYSLDASVTGNTTT
ncbi:MAG: putative Ig domain-containing protein, partial [Raineya sp.]|nr:putative Ig domain-containing protein [Raineya sp.]